MTIIVIFGLNLAAFPTKSVSLFLSLYLFKLLCVYNSDLIVPCGVILDI